MKRILTLLFMGAVFVQTQAQVLFFQDFESGVLDPMTAVDVDGKTVNPNVAGVAGPTFQVVQQTATNKMVVSTSWFEPVGQADDWLISPPLTVADSNTFLIWEAYSPDASYRDGYQVRISTTDDQIASFTNLALNVAAELTTLTKRSVKLDAYVGQTIYFAFRNNSNDKYLLFMDNIRVERLKKNNTILRNVTFEKYNAVNDEVPVKITVENYGATPITSLLFEYSVNGYPYLDTVLGLNIAPLRTLDITHSVSYTLAEAGEFSVNVNVTMPNGVDDEDPADNSASGLIYGLTEQLPKKVFVEEATGTWCIWCPRGAVNMDLIAALYPDLVMPVAVHNFDPMTIPEYDGPFSASVSGYPSGHVDRKNLDIDPSEFPNAVVAIQDRLVPVRVNTEVTWNAETRTASIKGTGSLSVASQANELRFACVITEDHVTGTDDGYAQANIYSGGAQGVMGGFEELPNPVPADQMVYHFVARALLGGFNGMENSIPDAVAADEDFEITFDYVVPEEYDETQMKAIIIVLDEVTGEVLNGDITGFTGGVSVPLVPAGRFVAYPNPATDVLNLEVDYQTDVQVTMAIYNTYGQLVRNLGQLDLTSGKQVKQIQVTDLASGNYILEMRNKNAVTALPFTKM
jgi:hypothetical protein